MKFNLFLILSALASITLYRCAKYDFETYNTTLEIVMPSDCDCDDCNCLLKFGGETIKLQGKKNDVYSYNINWSELDFDLETNLIETSIGMIAYGPDNQFGTIYNRLASFEPGINYRWEPANKLWEEIGKVEKDQKRTDIDAENEACIIGKWSHESCPNHEPETWVFNFDGTGVYISPFCDDACNEFAIVDFEWLNNSGNSIDIKVQKSRDCSASPSLYFSDDMNLTYSCETSTLTVNNTDFQRK